MTAYDTQDDQFMTPRQILERRIVLHKEDVKSGRNALESAKADVLAALDFIARSESSVQEFEAALKLQIATTQMHEEIPL